MSRTWQLASDLSALLRRGKGFFLAGSDPPESSQFVPLEECASGGIPVVHRLAIIYLMLPVMIWLVGWFEWWFGIPLALLLALGLWPALRPARTSLNWQTMSGALRQAARPTTIALLFIACAWVMVTAAGGVFDIDNSDWRFNRAVFLELAHSEWPIEPFASFREFLPAPIFLRHYLGYYMVPGQIGNWLGPAALNWAIPLWTWCGAGLLLLLFARGYAGGKAIVAAAILVFFSGMDIVRIALTEGLDWFSFSSSLQGWPQIDLGRSHLEWEKRFGVGLQYSSHMVGMMWVPKHFLAAGLLAMLLTQLQRHSRFLAVSGILLAAALFWSPFVAIGLLPLAAVLFVRNGMRPFLCWQNLLLPPPLVFILFVYLTSGSGAIERGWIWLRLDDLTKAFSVLPLFYLSEFLVLACLLVLMCPRVARDLFFIASLVVLLLLPLYSFGQNEIRIATPSLFLLCIYCVKIVTGFSFGQGNSRRLGRLLLLAATVGVLSLGAVTPIFDLVRANKNHNIKVVRHQSMEQINPIETTLLHTAQKYTPLFVTNELPGWYLQIWKRGDTPKPSPNEGLAIRSHYAVYVDSSAVVYVRDPCAKNEAKRRFFLQVTPTDKDNLAPGLGHYTYFFEGGRRIGNICLAVRNLDSSFEIGRIKTGQLNAEQTGHSWIGSYFSGPFRDRLLAEAGEPVIRSTFDVYFSQETGDASAKQLLYHNPTCNPEDLESRFFLHVTPVSTEDLPEKRVETGYEALDFEFSEFGGWNHGICFAMRDLPDYDILEIKTGQVSPSGSAIWQGSAAIRR